MQQDGAIQAGYVIFDAARRSVYVSPSFSFVTDAELVRVYKLLRPPWRSLAAAVVQRGSRSFIPTQPVLSVVLHDVSERAALRHATVAASVNITSYAGYAHCALMPRTVRDLVFRIGYTGSVMHLLYTAFAFRFAITFFWLLLLLVMLSKGELRDSGSRSIQPPNVHIQFALSIFQRFSNEHYSSPVNNVLLVTTDLDKIDYIQMKRVYNQCRHCEIVGQCQFIVEIVHLCFRTQNVKCRII